MSKYDAIAKFYNYCKTCKYGNKDEFEMPCKHCLELPIRKSNGHKPVDWERK